MKALIIVDVQNDFLPGGTLAVPNGDEVISFINAIQNRYDLVVATQDWHPVDHKSFISQHPQQKVYDIIQLKGIDQILWPVHCVQCSFGAEFSSSLDQSRIEAVFRKGTKIDVDSYSGFFDNNKAKNTGLHGYLQDRNVDAVDICGLAADFCVYYTAMDAIALGYRTVIVSKGTKAIDKESFMSKKIDFIRAGGSFI